MYYSHKFICIYTVSTIIVFFIFRKTISGSNKCRCHHKIKNKIWSNKMLYIYTYLQTYIKRCTQTVYLQKQYINYFFSKTLLLYVKHFFLSYKEPPLHYSQSKLPKFIDHINYNMGGVFSFLISFFPEITKFTTSSNVGGSI